MEESNISEDNYSEIIKSNDKYKDYDMNDDIEYNEYNENYNSVNNENMDVVMTGNLIYRYSTNQIELEGFWRINLDAQKENFSYLFKNSNEKICCLVKKDEIHYNSKDEYESYNTNNNDFVLNICSANIFEVILLPNETVFRSLLNYISGDYHGFFIYYEKTIEDQFMLNFSLDNDQIKITGILLKILIK